MNAIETKIITSLRERRLIEQEIIQLLQAASENEFNMRAQHIAASGDQVVPVILNNLDRSNPRMLNALGVISSLYPDRRLLADTLEFVASDEEKSDGQRIAAMLILERYLEVEPDPFLVNTLNDPQSLIKASIEEMLRQGEVEPLALIEYAQSLLDQAGPILDDIIGNLLRIGGARAVPILSLIAQEPPDELAASALHALGRIGDIQAAKELQVLCAMLLPARRALCERSLRKLQFKGIHAPSRPDPDDTCRALVSAPDSQGSQVVWLIRQAEQIGESLFLGLSLGEQGMAQAYGSVRIPEGVLPPQQPAGYVHLVSLPEQMLLHMLEADFDYGRRLARQAQQKTLDSGLALPVEYRLLGPRLWQYNERGLDQQFDLEVENPQELVAGSADLLSHQVFSTWFLYDERVVQHAMSMLKWPPLLMEQNLNLFAVEVVKLCIDSEAQGQYRERLELVAEWLYRARQTHLARVALAAARESTARAPQDHPFFVGMAEKGLRIIVEQLQKQFGFD